MPTQSTLNRSDVSLRFLWVLRDLKCRVLLIWGKDLGNLKPQSQRLWMAKSVRSENLSLPLVGVPVSASSPLHCDQRSSVDAEKPPGVPWPKCSLVGANCNLRALAPALPSRSPKLSSDPLLPQVNHLNCTPVNTGLFRDWKNNNLL